MLGESDRSVADILRDRHTDEDDRSDRDEAAAWLLDYLNSQGGSAKAADVIKAAAAHGIAKTTLTLARKRAGVRSANHGMTGGCVWTIEESTKGTEESRNPESGFFGFFDGFFGRAHSQRQRHATRQCDFWTDGDYCGDRDSHRYMNGCRCEAHSSTNQRTQA